jgi:very-short-patch-repair endonuclease
MPRRFNRTPAKTKRAQALRRDMTDAERKLWSALRGKQMAGVSFRRQHPVGDYVVDFYCPAAKLAIELDGGQHGFAANVRRDNRRTAELKATGIRVLRFWNNELTDNFAGVLETIYREVSASGEGGSTPTPTLPLSGGGSDCDEVDR